MIATQSIRVVADEIINMSKNQDLISINIIGKGGTGKSELARTLCCLIHSRAKLPYNVNYFSMKHMLDLEQTVKNLTPSNHLIVFDDIAFMKVSAGQQKVDEMQRVLSTIRHLPGGEDVRIIMFKLFQYSKSIPPFLRQNDATFISSVDDNEIQNFEELLGKRYLLKINLLKQLRAQAKQTDPSYFIYPLGTKGKGLTYKTMKPFLPFLYSNEVSCRMVVSPLRTWFQPICQTCSPAKQTEETKLNLEEFQNDFSKKFGKIVAKRAVELKLLQEGINTYPKRVLQAQKYIDQFLNEKEINFEGLCLAYNLKPTETKLFPNKQPEFIDKSKEIGGIFGFDVKELKLYQQEKKPRVNWVASLHNQSKEANLETYSLLYSLYKEKQDPKTAVKIKTLFNIIKRQK